MKLFITCPKGVESLLLEELRSFDIPGLKETQAGVQVDADLETAYKICLWSRLANRVLLLLKEATATSTEALYNDIKSINWLDHIRPEGTLSVDFNGQNEAINNTHFGAMKVKDAIVDRVREETGRRPSVSKQHPDLRINVHLRRTSAQIAVDLSGESLHRRGYRLQTGAAPLKENLAAAILIRSGWHKDHQFSQLVDPMCGAGTLLTEAAMMVADIAPGLLRRRWGFDRWCQHQSSIWQKIYNDAKERRKVGLANAHVSIKGFDADQQVISKAQANADALGIHNLVQFERCDLASLRLPNPEQNGLLVTNPPYGERLGETSSLRFLYSQLGDLLKAQAAHWRVGIFTSNPELGKVMGLRADKLYKLFNGPLPSQLLLFTVYPQAQSVEDESVNYSTESNLQQPEPSSLTSVNPASAVLSDGAQMLENRLRKNLKQLSRWVKREGIEAYRVYDADLPEYAVAIDRYGDQLVVQEYAPPASIDSVKAFKRLQDALNVVSRVFEVGTDAITLKQRKRQQGSDQYQRQTSQGDTLKVVEHGCQFEVNLRDYLDTGLFLDHRPVRKQVQSLAHNKRFLNLFCYTATASVHAAFGGAKTTTSVDMSATYLDWAKRNFELNQLPLSNASFIQADCIQWLDRPRSEQYDLIFMDPPTFSNSKRMNDVLDVQRDHVTLIQSAMRLLAKDGVLLFSNNYRRFKLDVDALKAYNIKDISAKSIDPDFKRNAKIHYCFEIRHG